MFVKDGTINCIEILDTSGFYQFPAMKELNIRLGTAFVLVFDLTDSRSLNNLVELRQIILNIKRTEDVAIILVGNKSDLLKTNDSLNFNHDFQNIVNSFKCPYIETSAKNDENILEVFKLLIETIFKDMDMGNFSPTYRRNSSISNKKLEQSRSIKRSDSKVPKATQTLIKSRNFLRNSKKKSTENISEQNED